MTTGGSKLEGYLVKQQETKQGEKPPDTPQDLKTTLEKELDGEDSELAKELQRTRAEEIIARRRIAIERLRAGQAVLQEPGAARTQERGKEWLTDVATGLLSRGLDPGVVGRTIDYLLGISSGPMVGLPGAPAPAQGMTFTDMKEIFKMGQESNKTDPAITSMLQRLTDKIEAIEHRPAPAPPEKKSFIVVKADGTFDEVEAGRPIILAPKVSAGGGEPIEVVKEKNRHQEEMARLEAEKKYNDQKAELLASIPEKIGRGLAGQIADKGGGGDAVANEQKMEIFKCQNLECGKEFQIPRDALKIQCPYCKDIYNREQKA